VHPRPDRELVALEDLPYSVQVNDRVVGVPRDDGPVLEPCNTEELDIPLGLVLGHLKAHAGRGGTCWKRSPVKVSLVWLIWANELQSRSTRTGVPWPGRGPGLRQGARRSRYPHRFPCAPD
jgi:hypothetical protein